MSAPPPSGPTQPPYQPYPQQPYPPPYPPQQPYYAPAAPPPKQDNTVLIVVVVVVVVIVAIGLVGLFMFLSAMNAANQATRITITGVSFTLSYTGASTGYFGTSQITSCSQCPITTMLVSPFSYTLTIHNNDSQSHSVDGITAAYPFQLTGTSPNPPMAIAAGMSTSFTLTIQSTTFGGSYTLSGTVTSSS